MSRGILTLTRQFTLRNGSAWHDLGHFFGKCEEISLLHCHPYKLRKNSQGWDFLSICVQSSSKCWTAALQILLYCSEISNYHYWRKSKNRKCWDLQRVIQTATEEEFSTSRVLPAVFFLHTIPHPSWKYHTISKINGQQSYSVFSILCYCIIFRILNKLFGLHIVWLM